MPAITRPAGLSPHLLFHVKQVMPGPATLDQPVARRGGWPL